MGRRQVTTLGKSVSMPDIYTLAIGASGNDGNGNNSGLVRVYQWSVTSWVQKGQDPDGENPGDWFGFSISTPSSNTIAIGGLLNDDNGSSAGHTRVYKLTGVYGQVYQDFNQNCIQDATETGVLEGYNLSINPGNILVQTNDRGQWFLDTLPTGTYTITADTTQPN